MLREIEEWIGAGMGPTKLLWLHGPAGAGKSAIAQTVAETCARRGQLAASFFFSRSSPDRNARKHLFPTITFQILLSSPCKRQKLQEILQDDPGITYRASGPIDLLVSLFRDQPGTLPDGSETISPPFLVIIDGLDECRGNDDQSLILSLIHDLVDKYRLPLRFLIASRPESHIQEIFDEPVMRSVTKVVSIYGDFGARRDVLTYLRDEFRRIQDSKRHQDVMQFVLKPWPPGDAIEQIADKSGGYFIYAATVIKYVDEEYFSCLDRLDQVLGNSAIQHDPEEMPFAELDRLYSNVLSRSPKTQLPLLKRVLGFLQAYVDASNIEIFLGLRRGQINLMLRGLRSIVAVDLHAGIRSIRSFHASFLDFLFDPARSKSYHVDIEEWHANNFHRIFSLLSGSKPVLQLRGIQNRSVHFLYSNIPQKLMYRKTRSNPISHIPPNIIEPCIMQCSRQCAKNRSLRDVIVHNLRVGTWPEDLDGSLQKSFNVTTRLLVRIIETLEVCHDSLCNDILR